MRSNPTAAQEYAELVEAYRPGWTSQSVKKSFPQLEQHIQYQRVADGDPVFEQGAEGARELFRQSIGSPLNGLLANYGRAIREVANGLAGDLPDVHVGLFPTDSVNGQMIVTRHGNHLILINEGLMIFLNRAAKLYVQASNVAIQEESSGEFVSGRIDYPEMSRQFYHLAAEYLGYASRFGKHPDPKGHRRYQAGVLTAAAEMFAISHEMVHVMVASGLLPSSAPADSGELVADTIGSMLLRKAGTGSLKLSELECMAGAYFLIGCLHVIETVAQTYGHPIDISSTRSHPTADERGAFMTEWLEQGNETYPQAEEVGFWVGSCAMGAREVASASDGPPW